MGLFQIKLGLHFQGVSMAATHIKLKNMNCVAKCLEGRLKGHLTNVQYVK